MAVVGVTYSDDLPTEKPLQEAPAGEGDAFVALLSPGGDRIEAATYLGGRGQDEAHGVAFQADGAIIVGGQTGSANFPIVDAMQGGLRGGRDGFVTRIAPEGSAIDWSTFVGGREADTVTRLAVTPDGAIAIVGDTTSTDFPTRDAFDRSCQGAGGCDDGFVARLAPDGRAVVHSSFLGGGHVDVASDVVAGGDGGLYVTGNTRSTDFPVRGAFQPRKAGGFCTLNRLPCSDAFIAAIGPNGALVFGSYLGGSHDDEGRAVAVGRDGSMYVVGSASSSDFPLVDPVDAERSGEECTDGLDDFPCPDAFVVRIEPAGRLAFSSYLGGSDWDSGAGVGLLAEGRLAISGRAQSDDFPGTDRGPGGRQDAFLSLLAGVAPEPTASATPDVTVTPSATITPTASPTVQAAPTTPIYLPALGGMGVAGQYQSDSARRRGAERPGILKYRP